MILDLTHRDRLTSGHIEASGARGLSGHRFSKGWAEDQRVFFATEFSREPDDIVVTLVSSPEGDLTAEARFRVARARRCSSRPPSPGQTNLAPRQPRRGASRLGLRRHTSRRRAAWNAELGKIDASGGTPEATTNFYTALYHTMIAPNVWSDVDGRYRGLDGAIHRAEHDVYTDFSLWDTFRTLHPLLTLIDPDRTRDFVRTFLLQYEQSGRLPVWELAANETNTMIGYHSAPVILDAYVKGIQGFDTEQALRAMVETATADIEGLPAFNASGFLTTEDEPESVSRTLEYAYDHWAVARMAEALGQDSSPRASTRSRSATATSSTPEASHVRAATAAG